MDYLYTLQCLREAAPAFLTSAFLFISENVLTFGSVVIFLVYWCFSKRTGEWMLFTWGLGMNLTDLIKLIACVPRPWLFDARLHLAKEAASSATGFSMPSMHTTYAVATFGTAAVYASNGPAKGQAPEDAHTLSAIGTVKQRRVWLSALFAVIVLLVAFARNWLGAHTFADVAVALVLTGAVAVGTYWLMKLVQEKPKADVWVLVGALVLIAAVGLYAELAPVPVVVDGAGNVLELDHYALRTDIWASMGIFAAIVVGWFVERRFIGFTDATTTRERIIRAVVGLAIFGLSYYILAGPLTAWIANAHVAKFCKRFVGFIFPTLVMPLLIKWYRNRTAK